MEKKTYYVNLGSGEISQIPYENNQKYTIQATADDIKLLRIAFDRMDQANRGAYARAHIPILAYHNDRPNDDYDRELTEVFQMLYDLGDQQTKDHIKESGVLADNHL